MCCFLLPLRDEVYPFEVMLKFVNICLIVYNTYTVYSLHCKHSSFINKCSHLVSKYILNTILIHNKHITCPQIYSVVGIREVPLEY